MTRNAMVPSRAALDERLSLTHLRILILLGVGAPAAPVITPLYMGSLLEIDEPWLSISLRELESWGYVRATEFGYVLVSDLDARALSKMESAAPNGHMPVD